MLKKNVKLRWIDTREILTPEGRVIAWTRFKENFMTKFFSKGARLKKQQEFTHFTQGEVSMYTRNLRN